MKFCIACVHYKGELCCREQVQVQSPETGRMYMTEGLDPETERKDIKFFTLTNICGKHGRYWEHK